MFKRESAEIYVPDGKPVEVALKKTTHMGIGAHQDDLEIMAFDGILKCFQQDEKWFCGVVVTNGSGSPRDDVYKDYTDDEMVVVRKLEQKKAAFVGEYNAQIFLDYSSSSIKNNSDQDPTDDLVKLLGITQPEVVYTHNLADKHNTHIGVAMRVIQAIRSLPENERPKKVFGCEVWRDLDWMVDQDKVVFDLSSHENLQAALLGVFDSQICGGKRYDLATLGRRRAHATYYESHGVDTTTGINFAMDLTPLVVDMKLDIVGYLEEHIDRFLQDVKNRVSGYVDQ
jgi:LmbE family N-acetylglucosaminyl deacetylase